MACGDWLARNELYALITHMAYVHTLDIDGMVRARMLISIERDGVHYFPRYALSATDNSYGELLQMIITVLGPQQAGGACLFNSGRPTAV